MFRFRLPPWVGIAAAVLAAGVLFAVLSAGWAYAERLGAEVLTVAGPGSGFETTVVDVGGGRVVLPRAPATIREGIWGLDSGDAYAQITSVLGITDEVVDREVQTFRGELVPGDVVRFDDDAFPGDPTTALGIGFEEVRIPGELGANPAWFVDGRRTTWVVVVHGRDHDRRQALRLLPTLVEEGFPVLVVSYRGDPDAAPPASAVGAGGLDAWRDLDAALAFAERKGAESFVVVGHDLGAEIVAMTLHESTRAGRIAGVVFDGPVLDLDELARDRQPRWAPGPVGIVGRQLAAVRWSVDWAQLDQVARADEFDVPILVLHGAKDRVVPIETAEAFVDARPDLFTLVRFERAGHGDLWNTDHERYAQAVVDFLVAVVGSS